MVSHPRTGVGRQLFTCIEVSLREVGPNHLVIEQTMKDGYPVCREFFLISKGAITTLPTMLGLGRAHVEMQEIPGSARYDILLPQGEEP